MLRRILAGGTCDATSETLWVEHACAVTIKRLRDELRLVDRERAWGAVDLSEDPPDDSTWHRSLVRRAGMSLERIRQSGARVLDAPAATDIISMRLPKELSESLMAAIDCRIRSLEEMVRADACGEVSIDPDAPASVLAARMFSTGAGRIPEWVGLLSLIEEFVLTWDDPRGAPKRAADRVYDRDGWRCSAPGCTSRRNLEGHHVVYLSRGGSEKLTNKTCLCRFHHQQGEHGGLATCRGWAPLGLIWTLGEGGKGGRYRNERTL